MTSFFKSALVLLTLALFSSCGYSGSPYTLAAYAQNNSRDVVSLRYFVLAEGPVESQLQPGEVALLGEYVMTSDGVPPGESAVNRVSLFLNDEETYTVPDEHPRGFEEYLEPEDLGRGERYAAILVIQNCHLELGPAPLSGNCGQDSSP